MKTIQYLFFDSKDQNTTISEMTNQPLTVLTACDGKLTTIEGLFGCLEKQTRLPQRIVLLVYVNQTREEFDYFLKAVEKKYLGLKNIVDIVSSHNSNHTPGKFHGYDRQFLVQQLTGENFALMIDIDNEVEYGFIASLEEEYIHLQKHKPHQELILAPTVMRRKSGRIQSQGIQGYSFLIPKYHFASFTEKDSPQKVILMGGNCLFGKTQTFQNIGFDPMFAYSYEDIDFTYRLTQSGVSLYVTSTIVTYHMESERSKLDQKLIGTPTSAYFRMRNYILFVRKNATVFQKIQAFGFSIWGLYGWFVLYILMYGNNKKFKLIKALSNGLIDGLFKEPLQNSSIF